MHSSTIDLKGAEKVKWCIQSNYEVRSTV